VVLVGGLLFLGAGTMVTHAGERDDDRHQRNPFQRILDKLDKILDAVKGEGGQDGNHMLRWDQALPAAQRFVVLAAFNNEAVLDKNTGLVWEKAPQTTPANWSSGNFANGPNDAILTCINKNVGGQRGFRLPSIPELASLIDPSVPFPGPSLPPGHPFLNVLPSIDVSTSTYWSATTWAGDTRWAWTVNFGGGSVTTVGKTNDFVKLWCVRGGMNADQY
jgi:hypothetical protein